MVNFREYIENGICTINLKRKMGETGIYYRKARAVQGETRHLCVNTRYYNKAYANAGERTVRVREGAECETIVIRESILLRGNVKRVKLHLLPAPKELAAASIILGILSRFVPRN